MGIVIAMQARRERRERERVQRDPVLSYQSAQRRMFDLSSRTTLVIEKQKFDLEYFKKFLHDTDAEPVGVPKSGKALFIEEEIRKARARGETFVVLSPSFNSGVKDLALPDILIHDETHYMENDDAADPKE
jgi:hypothetical protein